MIDIFGIKIYGYGLLIGLGVWLGWEIILRIAKKKGLEEKTIDEGIIWVIIGAVIGARIYHVVDFWDKFYKSNLLDILFIWRGGLGIWGAIIGGCLMAIIYAKLKHLKLLKFTDTVVVGAPVAQAVGRLGNWVNHEIVGKNGEPLFAYEAILNLILFLFLWKRTDKKNGDGKLTGFYFIGYGIIRLLLENFRPDEIIWKWKGIPVAMIVSVVFIFMGLLLALFAKDIPVVLPAKKRGRVASPKPKKKKK